MAELTPKQKRFVEEYLVDLNATKAAERAGYSADTARQIGSENLSKPVIQEAINVAVEERSQRVEVTQDMVVRELAMISFVDIRQAFDADGNLLPVKDLPENVARAIGGLDLRHVKTRTLGNDGEETVTEEEYVKNLKLIDKKGGLELLGRHLKMFGADANIDLSGLSIKVIYD
jgi:phage terminase small subunit